MANGPMTEEQTKQSEWSLLWLRLPEEMKAGLAKLEADHPGEVLAAVTGGVITGVPEGKELDSWMAELASAAGGGAVDVNAQSFTIDTYWADPQHPAPGKTVNVGVQAAALHPIELPVELAVTITSQGSGEIVQVKSVQLPASGESQIQGTVELGVDAELGREQGQNGFEPGNYTVEAYLNNGGVDPGSAPGPEGYRTMFSFTLTVGDFDESLVGYADRAQVLSDLAAQLGAASDAADLGTVLGEVVQELRGVHQLADQQDILANLTSGIRFDVELIGHKLREASESLGLLAGQLTRLPANPTVTSDPAAVGVLVAYLQQFAAQVREAVTGTAGSEEN